MSVDVAFILYLVSAALFIFGLKQLSGPKTAVRGNLTGATAMALAVIVTLIVAQPPTANLIGILVAMVLAAAVGATLSKKIAMTAMPVTKTARLGLLP